MSIRRAIDDLSVRIDQAYDVIDLKGGMVPPDRNSYNLSSAIDSIPTGGSEPAFPPRLTVDDNGEGIYNPNGNFICNAKSIPEKGLYFAYSQLPTINTISFPQLTSINNEGMYKSFQECMNVQSASFDSLTVMLNNAMYNCFYNCSISSISLPQLRKVGQYGFHQCFQNSNIRSLEFPSLSSVTTLSFYDCADNCTKLSSVSFSILKTPGTKTFKQAFWNCTSLISVDFPELTATGIVLGMESYAFQWAFAYCSNLSSITFPKLKRASKTSFEEAFLGSGLKYAYFPELTSVTNTSFSNAFNGCNQLQEVHFKASVESTLSSTTWGTHTGTIYYDL